MSFKREPLLVVTSVELPGSLRADCDVVRAELAVRCGRRPSLKEIVARALQEFVDRELARPVARRETR